MCCKLCLLCLIEVGPGHVKPGQSACVDCPAGRFAAELGSLECAVCGGSEASLGLQDLNQHFKRDKRSQIRRNSLISAGFCFSQKLQHVGADFRRKPQEASESRRN